MSDQENQTTSKMTAKNFLDAFKESYSRLSPRNKIAILAGIPLVFAIFMFTILWSTETKYQVLFSNLSGRDGGAIIASLDQMKVPYQMDDNGTAILVPADKVHETRLRLATQGLPQGGNVGFELLDNSRLGRSQFELETTYQRALEGELSRTIQSLGNIELARVHLAIPKPSLFLRNQTSPTASVMIQMLPGRSLERNQVDGIVHLVSSSVPSLLPSAVSIVDQNGLLLSTDNNNANKLDGEQLQIVQNLEQQYSQRIRAMLIPVVGADNIRAQVTVDVDFSAQERTEKIFGPNVDPNKASLRSRMQNNSSEPVSANPEGVPGTLTNTPPGGGTAPLVGNAQTNPDGTPIDPAANQVPMRVNNSSTENFEVNESVTYTNEPRGRVRRVSAAVLINNRLVKANNGNMVSTPLSNQELEQITALVRDAVGATDVRKDTVSVMNIPFDATQTEGIKENFWQAPGFTELALKSGFGIAILAAVLYLIFGVIRPAIRQLLAPAPLTEEESMVAGIFDMDPQPDPLELARSIARENPQVVALVIRQWLSGESPVLPGPNTGGNTKVS